MIINPRSFHVDKSLIDRCLRVTPASVGHYLDFGVMSSAIKPVYRGCKIAGPAITVRTLAMDSTVCHYVMGMVQPGDVIVIDRSGDHEAAAVGEMVALAAKARQAAAIVVDGAVTDIAEIEEMGMPVFARRASALATRLLGISGEINTVVQCGGVAVHPGDIVFADDNGVVVIPPDKADAVLRKAEQAEAAEVEWKRRIRNGELLADLSGAARLVQEATGGQPGLQASV